jgi:fatty acid desaturase
MAQTQRKTAYVQPEHHDILRRIAFEQRCSISDVLDTVLEQADWDAVARESGKKPIHRAKERENPYKV